MEEGDAVDAGGVDGSNGEGTSCPRDLDLLGESGCEFGREQQLDEAAGLLRVVAKARREEDECWIAVQTGSIPASSAKNSLQRVGKGSGSSDNIVELIA